ncbi:MAG: aminoacetone oxidase family FAD-binding enzyme [Prevotella sp.]|nr:aminoacetone oxidase family FAD-binding enzyme [Prevotella sp.]
MRTAIIGGGAAGFFLAINLKEMLPAMQVTIFERSQKVLAKVEVSGGGRCNCTNTFEGIADLKTVYPRGHRLMKRLFKTFNQQDAYRWFEQHGVALVVQADHCVFTAAQDSHAVIDCFMSLARRYDIKIERRHGIESLDELSGFDYVVVTTGGSPRGSRLQWLSQMGHEIAEPVPSLFSLAVADEKLTALQGAVVEHAQVMLPGTKLRADGPLLVTHWGLSGPAMLRLSSYAAHQLADCGYKTALGINWVAKNEEEVRDIIGEAAIREERKQIATFSPFEGLSQRLWAYMLDKALGARSGIRWGEINQKDMNRLVSVLTCDVVHTSGRAPFSDEFVTCGGVALGSVNPATLESRHVPHLYFAGEVLDIDGITGGFNFQAAWTTAYTVAKAITERSL